MRDVRATHFQLGDDGRSFTTTARELESKGVEGGAGVKAAGPRRGSGLHLGSDGSSYSTTNAMPAHEAGAGAVAVKVDTHSTHFELGEGRGDFVTTSMASTGQAHPERGLVPSRKDWRKLLGGGGEGKAAPRARPRDGVQLGSDKVEYFRAHRDDFAWPEGEQVQGEWRVLCGVWRECECECVHVVVWCLLRSERWCGDAAPEQHPAGRGGRGRGWVGDSVWECVQGSAG